jgi:nucleoside-diphosphate-sugar epimerase
LKRRVFLTGCTGEIGSRLVFTLIGAGYEVFGTRGSRICKIQDPSHSCVSVDLLNTSQDLKLSEIRPDVLIHTAWMTTPNEFWESELNAKWVIASKRIIEDFILSGGSYAVVTGSCAEYAWGADVPLSEDSPELPSSQYGKAKLELLDWLRQKPISFLWTRTFFQFGMLEPNGRLIPTAIDSLLNGREFLIRSASDVRDFVFVEDVAKILANLVANDVTGVINIGSGAEMQVRALAYKISELMGRNGLIVLEDHNPQTSFVVSNPEKLKTVIGDFSWTPIDTALKHTIAIRKS